ncbi:MAG: helix-turn-helix transcriptional regulator [Phormidesmis sp.]
MPLAQRSKISDLRERAGITQVQLAALIGVTPNTIQNWEKPNGLKQLERYLKMAALFGCQVEELVEYVQVEADGDETNKPKAFSIDEIRELRKRWGTGTSSTNSNPNGQETQKV